MFDLVIDYVTGLTRRIRNVVRLTTINNRLHIRTIDGQELVINTNMIQWMSKI